ncbi:hypothetical protein HY949_05500 [Candidatus Gottesmanbacteria bacterium]|nr:hypothetical protein [Candidatus Gottesmanbacteria bacterium]
MQRTIFLLCIVVLLYIVRTSAYAIYDPLSVANNKFGIHVADPNDIESVGELVNSGQGDWGYVTLVIADHERKSDVWQPVFDRMRQERLIPIVRLATHIEGSAWVKPQEGDATVWADFLDALPWPTKNRYVILFNEPNHAKEWGGSVSPNEYARIVTSYSQALRQTSEDFFILPAGLDASAPNGVDTMDEVLFLQWLMSYLPNLEEYIDGWTSHSYPNPGFTGSPYARGRGTIGTFEWELQLVSDMGVQKKLPVFITETGWAHNGNAGNRSRVSPDDVSRYLLIASDTIWNHPQIAAVTPFLYSYQDPLFAMFSWLHLATREPYPFYRAYQQIAKVKGLPRTYPMKEFLALLAHPLTL